MNFNLKFYSQILLCVIDKESWLLTRQVITLKYLLIKYYLNLNLFHMIFCCISLCTFACTQNDSSRKQQVRRDYFLTRKARAQIIATFAILVRARLHGALTPIVSIRSLNIAAGARHRKRPLWWLFNCAACLQFDQSPNRRITSRYNSREPFLRFKWHFKSFLSFYILNTKK